eukprot:COSAG01_NODE_57923_length_309_cov_0.857143_1_plen_57_part_01
MSYMIYRYAKQLQDMAQSEAEMVRAIHRQHAAHMDERVAQIAELEAFRDAHLSAAST